MKIIVTHTSPDWDAIGGVWLLKKFLPGWQDAVVEFVPAGQKKGKAPGKELAAWEGDPIEMMGKDEVIHVDTGMGPLDHHQVYDTTISGTSRCWDYVRAEVKKSGEHLTAEHEEAISRIVQYIVDTDHFLEVYWADAGADHHEFSLLGLLEGEKLLRPDEDQHYIEFGMHCLDAMMNTFENRIWAEKEIADNGIAFPLKQGKGMAFETINDTVLKLAQKMGYKLVVRKDPRKGYVRIKTTPASETEKSLPVGRQGIDLTLAYEQLKKIDPEATWFLHVSRKMLLNGTPKNPTMIPTKLSLQQIVDVLKSIY